MAVTSFDGQFSFKQDTLARLGHRESRKMSTAEQEAFQNSPFMQGVRKTEDLCWTFTCSRDQERSKRDPTFQPRDEDFSAPKAHQYDKCINYYKVLGIDEYASLEEVKKAYKKLSLVYHPDKTAGLDKEQQEEYAAIFIELKNSYLTLGDQATRRQYDRDRDRDKASFEISGFKIKTRAHFDATEVLKKLQELQRPPGRVVDMIISAKLEKFVFGAHKKVKRQRRVKDFSGFRKETRLYRIDIPKGAAEPHECLFRRQGDHQEATQPDSLNFRVCSKVHDLVDRRGDDLACKRVVQLGEGALREPFLSAEAPSVRGRHLLLWGRNPFWGEGATAGTMRVRVHGQGVTQGGQLHILCRLGAAATSPAVSSTAGPSAVSSSGAQAANGQKNIGDTVVITVRHMQTDGKLWLRLPRTAMMLEVRLKIEEVLGLPRGATVRLLQPITGGFTPYSDRQPLGGLQTLYCAGAVWHGVTFTPVRSRQLLQQLVDKVQDPSFQEAVAAARDAWRESPDEGARRGKALFARLAELLPDFGCEASPTALRDCLAAACGSLKGALRPGDVEAAMLLQRAEGLEESIEGPPPSRAAVKPRRGLKRFLVRFNLGPPGGFQGAGSETEDEHLHMREKAAEPQTFASNNGVHTNGTRSSSSSSGGSSSSTCPLAFGSGGLCESPALHRRQARVQGREQTSEVELFPLGEPVALFTRPCCTIAFYSNARQPSRADPGLTAPRAVFAICLSSPPCAKSKAERDWESLKARLVPLLRLTGFHLLRQARALLPKALCAVPAFGSSARSCEATEAELQAAEQGELDLELLAVEVPGEAADARHRRLEAALRDRRLTVQRRLLLRRLLQPGAPPTPWKRLGDDAFKRGDYFTAMAAYTSCLVDLQGEGERGEALATVLSNRAACFAKVQHFEESLADARAALELRPRWGRAWSRVGLAAASLSRAQEALEAYMEAVTFEPSTANVQALADVVRKREPNAEEAHTRKEMANGAMRAGEYGRAVAEYTYCIALVPPDPKALNPHNPGDEHALLRAVLLSNRSAAFARLRSWPQALADAEQAVGAKGDFVQGHCRLGTALLGLGHTERAYAEFARALQLEGNHPCALRGRQATLTLLPRWLSTSARRRLQDRFGADMARRGGTTKVYAVSDVHFDHKCNEEWAHSIDDFKFRDDVLIVAGNMCDTRNALVRALTTFKSKFRRVFYVPGNHELWVHPSEATKYPDTFAKLMALLDVCDETGTDIFPAAVAEDVFIVPMFSWYNEHFDEGDPFPDPNVTVDQHCRWPIPDTQVWKYMMKMNAPHLDRPYHGTVVSFSHFLPHRRLPFLARGSAAKFVGCAELEEQIQRIGGHQRVHVYGHVHRKNIQFDNGVWYVNHFHGEEGGKEARAPLLLVYDGHSLAKRPEAPFDGP